MNNTKYILNNGNLIFAQGFDNILDELKQKYESYGDQYIKLKHVYSNINGIVRFEFVIVNDKVKEAIKDIETKLTYNMQKEVFEVYVVDFQKTLLDYFTEKLEKLKKEMEEKDGVEYLIFPSHVTMFQYLKNSAILRLEILL